jgi:hypothetical protein
MTSPRVSKVAPRVSKVALLPCCASKATLLAFGSEGAP